MIENDNEFCHSINEHLNVSTREENFIQFALSIRFDLFDISSLFFINSSLCSKLTTSNLFDVLFDWN